jgi:hypothetical protein
MVALSTGDVTSVSDAPSGRNLHYAEIDNQKNEYNFETVHVRQEMCIEH